MKSSIYVLLFVLALPALPLANAGQAPDPELAIAQERLDEAFTCVPPPYVSVECLTLSGGTVVTKFTKLFGDQIIAQAIQAGSSPREWRVTASCGLPDQGLFDSSQGFRPWKRELLDICKACVDDASCLSLLP